MVKQAPANEVEIIVDRIPAGAYSAEAATLSATLPISGRTASVSVYGPDSAFGEPRPAKVNWSSIGAVTATDAAVYAALIAKAAEVAPTLAPATAVAPEVAPMFAEPTRVLDSNGQPCRAATPASYPLRARCVNCDRSISAADGTAAWVHDSTRDGRCSK